MTLFNAIKVNTLLYADGRLLRIIFAFIRFLKPKLKVMGDLDQQLLNLIFEKFDIKNDIAEGAIESLMLATLRLERARVAFLALEPDADFIDTASGLEDGCYHSRTNKETKCKRLKKLKPPFMPKKKNGSLLLRRITPNCENLKTNLLPLHKKRPASNKATA
mgnify:CR=1 FL=1